MRSFISFSRAGGLRLDYDHGVIVAILDDLLFTSKIKSAATQLGAAVTFARSADNALAAMDVMVTRVRMVMLSPPRDRAVRGCVAGTPGWREDDSPRLRPRL